MSSFKGFRFKLCLLTLVLLSLTSLVACGPKTPEPPPPLTVEMLKNAEYHSEWPAEGVAKLTDGEYQEEIVPGAASKLTIVVYPDMYAFGDLNGDGVDDAAVVLATSGGGSGTFISLEAVINDKGTPKHVASAELGDRERAAQLLEYIRYRSGLLIERRSGVFAFAHLTFQEYLAALAIEQGNRLEIDQQFLLEHREDDEWQEVIPLYCGLATEPNTRALISELVEQPPTERLGYLLAHDILAAGRKLPAAERELALRCCARCPQHGLPDPSVLDLFPPDEVRKIANEELGKIKVKDASNAYGWLMDDPSHIHPQVLSSTIPELEDLTPFGRGEVIHLMTSRGPRELVSPLLSCRELLQLEGPNYSKGAVYPTLAWVALSGVCNRLQRYRSSSPSASDISWNIKLLDATIDAILARPLPAFAAIPASLRPARYLERLAVRWTSEGARQDFTATSNKLDRFAEELERQIDSWELPPEKRAETVGALQSLRLFARALRGEQPVDEDEQKK